MPAKKDYYEILGVPPDATRRELQKTWRALIMRWHPDRNPGNPEANVRTLELNEIRERLFDPAKRRDYDLLYNARALQLFDPTVFTRKRIPFEEPSRKERTSSKMETTWEPSRSNTKEAQRDRNIYYGINEDGYVQRPSWAQRPDDSEWDRRVRQALTGDILLEVRGNAGCIVGALIGFLTFSLWGIAGGGIIGWLLGIGLTKTYLRTAWFISRSTIAGILIGLLLNTMGSDYENSVAGSLIPDITSQVIVSAVISFIMGIGLVYFLTDRPSNPNKTVSIVGIILAALGLTVPCFLTWSSTSEMVYYVWILLFVLYVIIDASVMVNLIGREAEPEPKKHARTTFRP